MPTFSPKLVSVLKQIDKAYGKNSTINLQENPKNIKIISSTGSLGLDIALGSGGVPEGRILEIYGPESSGKTTITLHFIAEAQKAGKVCAFIDAEHSFDPIYATAIGINLDNLIFSQPDNGEHALNIVETLANSGEVALIVIDSVAALVPKSELEGNMEDHSVGVHARLMSRALRKLTGVVSKTQTTLVFINQLREKIGVMYGNPEVTTGGNALKFYASARIDVRRKGIEKHTASGIEYKTGNVTKIKIAKNKLAPPFKECSFIIEYGKGINKDSELVEAGLYYDVLKQTSKGIFVNFKTDLWGPDEPIESTINYATEVLKDPEVWFLKESIEVYLAVAMNHIEARDGELKVKEIEEKFEKQETSYTEHFKEGSEATTSSLYAKAIYHLNQAIEVRPYAKEAIDKLKVVEKRVQERLNRGEEVNLIYNGINVLTGEITEKENVDTKEIKGK